MKSFNVKSNAKRFARGLVEKATYPGLEVREPVEVSPGAREWWPAVAMTVALGPSAIQELEAVAYVWSTGEVLDTMLDAALGPEPDPVDASGLKAAFDAIPPVGDVDELVAASAPPAPSPTPAEIAAAIPPLTPSTPEEIAQRRAERRARIDAEKAAGTRTKTGERVKINKTQKILDLINRDGGATQNELESATGWQRHTLRGFIAGTLRKRLAPVGRIECTRAKDGNSVYRFVKGGAE